MVNKKGRIEARNVEERTKVKETRRLHSGLKILCMKAARNNLFCATLTSITAFYVTSTDLIKIYEIDTFGATRLCIFEDKLVASSAKKLAVWSLVKKKLKFILELKEPISVMCVASEFLWTATSSIQKWDLNYGGLLQSINKANIMSPHISIQSHDGNSIWFFETGKLSHWFLPSASVVTYLPTNVVEDIFSDPNTRFVSKIAYVKVDGIVGALTLDKGELYEIFFHALNPVHKHHNKSFGTFHKKAEAIEVFNRKLILFPF